MYLVKTWNWEHISHTMHTILTKRTYYARHLNQGRRLLYSLWTSTLCPSIYLLINSCLTSLLWEVYKCVHLTFTFFFLSVKHHNLILNSLFCCMWTSAAVLMSLMLTCISSPPTPCLFLHIKHKTSNTHTGVGCCMFLYRYSESTSLCFSCWIRNGPRMLSASAGPQQGEPEVTWWPWVAEDETAFCKVH